jgi:hypothetical protein
MPYKQLNLNITMHSLSSINQPGYPSDIRQPSDKRYPSDERDWDASPHSRNGLFFLSFIGLVPIPPTLTVSIIGSMNPGMSFQKRMREKGGINDAHIYSPL